MDYAWSIARATVSVNRTCWLALAGSRFWLVRELEAWVCPFQARNLTLSNLCMTGKAAYNRQASFYHPIFLPCTPSLVVCLVQSHIAIHGGQV